MHVQHNAELQVSLPSCALKRLRMHERAQRCAFAWHDAELQTALLSRGMHADVDTSVQHISNTLWAVAELQQQVDADTHAAPR